MTTASTCLVLSLVLNGLLFVFGDVNDKKYVINVGRPRSPGITDCSYFVEISGNGVVVKWKIPCHEGKPFVIANENFALFQTSTLTLYANSKQPGTLVEVLDGKCKKHTFKITEDNLRPKITKKSLWSFTCNKIREEIDRVKKVDDDKYVVNVGKPRNPGATDCSYFVKISGKGVVDRWEMPCTKEKPLLIANENFALFETSAVTLYADSKHPGTLVEFLNGKCKKHTFKTTEDRLRPKITTKTLWSSTCKKIREEIEKVKS